MKSFFLGIAMMAMVVVSNVNGSIVTLDDYNTPSFPPAPTSNTQNYFTNSTVSFNGLVFSGGSDSILVGNGSQISYTFNTPFTRAQFAPNWLLTFNTAAGGSGVVSVSASVNGGAAQSVNLVAGASPASFSLNFMDAAASSGLGSGNVNSLVLNFASAGGSVFLDSISATPEPASMFTAGAFSLLGALVYRRKKSKKITV